MKNSLCPLDVYFRLYINGLHAPMKPKLFHFILRNRFRPWEVIKIEEGHLQILHVI